MKVGASTALAHGTLHVGWRQANESTQGHALDDASVKVLPAVNMSDQEAHKPK
jgi:hypothetical protein